MSLALALSHLNIIVPRSIYLKLNVGNNMCSLHQMFCQTRPIPAPVALTTTSLCVCVFLSYHEQLQQQHQHRQQALGRWEFWVVVKSWPPPVPLSAEVSLRPPPMASSPPRSADTGPVYCDNETEEHT